MGLLDKVKAQATAATEMAKDAAAKGQAKLDEVQAKKAADGMLRDLGAAFYATKTGRATPTTDADIERLVAALQAHESEHGPITLAPESAAAAPTAAPADGATEPRPRPAPAPAGGRPGVAAPTAADGADALGRRPARPGRDSAVAPWSVRLSGVGCLLRRGVEQSGSSSGS